MYSYAVLPESSGSAVKVHSRPIGSESVIVRSPFSVSLARGTTKRSTVLELGTVSMTSTFSGSSLELCVMVILPAVTTTLASPYSTAATTGLTSMGVKANVSV